MTKNKKGPYYSFTDWVLLNDLVLSKRKAENEREKEAHIYHRDFYFGSLEMSARLGRLRDLNISAAAAAATAAAAAVVVAAAAAEADAASMIFDVCYLKLAALQ